MTRSTISGALGAAVLLAGLTAAQAAPSADDASTKVAEASARIHPVAAIERDDETACSRTRRRLWIDGEGWVVRRITTCR